jgi:hypothetical protein
VIRAHEVVTLDASARKCGATVNANIARSVRGAVAVSPDNKWGIEQGRGDWFGRQLL